MLISKHLLDTGGVIVNALRSQPKGPGFDSLIGWRQFERLFLTIAPVPQHKTHMECEPKSFCL